MKGLYVLSLLLCVNIAVSSYLIFLAADFHRDVRAVKAGAALFKDVWDVTTGSLPAKVRVAASRGGDLKEWIKGKLSGNKTKD